MENKSKTEARFRFCVYMLNDSFLTKAICCIGYWPTILKIRYSKDPLLELVLGLRVRVKIAYVRNSGPSE